MFHIMKPFYKPNAKIFKHSVGIDNFIILTLPLIKRIRIISLKCVDGFKQKRGKYVNIMNTDKLLLYLNYVYTK